MNILFVGNMKSPFMRQDFELLSEDNNVISHDLSIHTSYNFEIIKYSFNVIKLWKNILNTDIIWIWAALPHAIPFILLTKIFHKPVIVNIGGWEVYNAPDINYGNQLSPINGAITRWIIRNATHCIVPSPPYREIVKKLEPKATISIIPNWVDSKLCDEILPEKKNLIITTMCSPDTQLSKGIATFEQVSKTIPYEMKVIKRVPRAEYIQLLKTAKVYCQLSRVESFGISLLEAMAYGCVPVITDRDALPWVSGNSGIVVPYGNVELTRRAILKALKMNNQMARDQARRFNKERKKLLINKLLRNYANK